MITFKMIQDAQNQIIDSWGEAGEKVIEECAKVTPFNNGSKAFLEHCTACGGNWGGMLLSGIRKLYPEVWDAIPGVLGVYAFNNICSVLILCGVDTTEQGEEQSPFNQTYYV